MLQIYIIFVFHFPAESAEALLSFKNGGYKVKRELDFGEDMEQATEVMTLGPEMFGLKRINDVSSVPAPVKAGANSATGAITLNRRGIVSPPTSIKPLTLLNHSRVIPCFSTACQDPQEEPALLRRQHGRQPCHNKVPEEAEQGGRERSSSSSSTDHCQPHITSAVSKDCQER